MVGTLTIHLPLYARCPPDPIPRLVRYDVLLALLITDSLLTRQALYPSRGSELVDRRMGSSHQPAR
jgi:hypothetical protein